MAENETTDLPTKIALVGYTSTRVEAPWDDPSWEVYGLNDLHKYIDATRCAGWFDLHDMRTITDNPHHVEWLKQTKIPVYTWKPQPEWPTAIAFPKDEVEQAFSGLRGSRYFTNSISWMTAWALWRLAPALRAGLDCEIGIYGVDMAQGSEYSAQRPSCEYWIGVAEALGVTVTIPPASDLLKAAFQYGVDDDSDLRVRLTRRNEELDEQMGQLRGEEQNILSALEQCRYRMHAVMGAKESNQYILSVWMQPEVKRGPGDPAASDGHVPETQEVKVGGERVA